METNKAEAPAASARNDVGDIHNFVSISDLAQCEKDTIINVLGMVKSTGELAEITTRAVDEVEAVVYETEEILEEAEIEEITEVVKAADKDVLEVEMVDVLVLISMSL